jgi:hypothetical protein
VTVNALHPGVIATNLMRAGWGSGGGRQPRAGAATPVYLALDPAAAGVTGQYFVDQRPTAPSPAARDEALQERFWEISARLTGLGPETPTAAR